MIITGVSDSKFIGEKRCYSEVIANLDKHIFNNHNFINWI